MNICIDVGNSTISFGEYNKNKLVNTAKARYDLKWKQNNLIDFIIKNLKSSTQLEKVNKVIYSSVVPEVDKIFINALNNFYNKKIQVVELKKAKSKIKFNIDNPKEVGADLIADLVGATYKYELPILIVDLGTASKILYIDEKSRFCSANFLPGIKLCANSLGRDTSLLPKIDLSIPKTVVAKNTIDAMNTGLVLGHVYMIEGFIERYKKEVNKNVNVIVTGGYMNLVKPLMNKKYIYDETLTLDGLNSLLENK